MGVRYELAPYLLTMGMDQACYDFMLWWDEFPDDHYDWENISLLYLSYWGKNRSKPLRVRKHGCLYFYVADALKKYNLFTQTKAYFTFLLGTHSKNTQQCAVKKFIGQDSVLRHIASYISGEPG